MKIENLTLSYGENTVIKNLTFDVKEGEITSILGASGVGKTTLLKWFASLKKGNVLSPTNSVSFVFQEPRLINNISVLKNLTLVGASQKECESILKEVGLEDKINSKAGELSGGEMQRVNLARAFLNPKNLCLMDEPFSSLDLKTKLELFKVFNGLYKKHNQTVIFVTHDIEEALFLSNRVLLLKQGGIALDLTLDGSSPREYGSNLKERKILLDKIIE